MNVYSHWLSPLSFVLALQVTTTSSTLLVASLVVNPTFARTITSDISPQSSRQTREVAKPRGLTRQLTLHELTSQVASIYTP